MEAVSANPVSPSGLVVVGTSLGGLAALEQLLAGLPSRFPWPVVIVQHRSRYSESTLADLLQRHTALRVREPVDKEELQPGHAYLAPADYHLLIDGRHLALSTEAPVLYARPSIDVLFESAAESFGAAVVGVALTSASADGARGAARIKARGGRLVVQAPETAECPVLPRAVLAATPVDHVLPLEAIAPFLVSLCHGDYGNGTHEEPRAGQHPAGR